MALLRLFSRSMARRAGRRFTERDRHCMLMVNGQRFLTTTQWARCMSAEYSIANRRIRKLKDEGLVRRIAGIQILRPNDLELYREDRKPIMRNTALKLDNRNAFVWSSGYVPHLLTYPGREVPTPLKIRIVFGDSKIEQVIADILALTKVNFNACIFSDGFPVTLRFADDIGEILTAIPEVTSKPLMFRHYI
jgi:hypothetical protein